MQPNCPTCDSPRTKSNGVREYSNRTVQRRLCMNCSKSFEIEIDPPEKKKEERVEANTNSNPKLEAVNQKFGGVVQKKTKYVITSAQNDTDTNLEFFGALLNYCKINDAQLLIIPVRYVNPTIYNRQLDMTWDKNLVPYFCDNNFDISPDLKVLGDLKINATMASPLTGLDALTQGKSTIVGHSQLQLKSIPRMKGTAPIILTTTGSVSCENYSSSRVGYIAEFNHSFSAALVELDNDCFHLRQLIGDSGNGFYDLGSYYTNGSYTPNDGTSVAAIVFGDEHAGRGCEENFKACFGKDGLVDSLRPNYLIRHDIFDCHSVNHHDVGKFFKLVQKSMHGNDDLLRELSVCADYLERTTPDYTTSVVVSSNHDRALLRYLESKDAARDIKNSFIYTTLRGMVLKSMSSGVGQHDPFVLWTTARLEQAGTAHKFKFLDLDESFVLEDTELGMHGSEGANGSRPSMAIFSRLGVSTISGHAHAPEILKGAWRTGTSTVMDLSYNTGLSSWMASHVILYKGGKKQLINVINGKFKV